MTWNSVECSPLPPPKPTLHTHTHTHTHTHSHTHTHTHTHQGFDVNSRWWSGGALGEHLSSRGVHSLNHQVIQDHFSFGTFNDILFNTAFHHKTIDVYLEHITAAVQFILMFRSLKAFGQVMKNSSQKEGEKYRWEMKRKKGREGTRMGKEEKGRKGRGKWESGVGRERRGRGGEDEKDNESRKRKENNEEGRERMRMRMRGQKNTEEWTGGDSCAYTDLVFLPNPVCSCLSLQIILRVPIRVKNDDSISSRQVYTKTPSTSGKKKAEILKW